MRRAGQGADENASAVVNDSDEEDPFGPDDSMGGKLQKKLRQCG